MEMEKLEKLGIRNLYPVFGRGVRGETLARRGLMGEVLRNLAEHGRVERRGGLHNCEACFFMKSQDLLCAFMGVRGAGHLRAREPVPGAVHPHPVADFAPEQPVYGDSEFLSADIPQCHLDGTDDLSPGFERSHSADAAHHVLYVGGIASEDLFFKERDVHDEVVLILLQLGIPVDPLVGNDPQNDIPSDDRAFQSRDLHAATPCRAVRPGRFGYNPPLRSLTGVILPCGSSPRV